ncbi:RDD family protein [Corynebacterium halotolerans]|uniref:RDD domain-containing protein n=1 Tax=Corynebacterium halotolerans YIM 70093 = DSM 44683 TaxID=1121362 RepID=M1NQ72_9CORY|nr:RDD family protein [Corynebacterium halotolerans]AGF71652.1 hypothetical protein A605_03195 [Corynebacterium halotolerans YIM 70093 = DSM 44683]
MTPTPDLYQLYGLDRSQSSEGIAILLSGRDATLENQGVPADAPQRQQVQVAYAVLKSEGPRAIYDEALASGRPLAWHELEYLGNFGSLPAPTAQPGPGPTQFPQPNPFAPPVDTRQQSPYQQAVPGYGAGVPFHTPAPYPAYGGSHPSGAYGGTAGAEDRPTAGLRLGMMLLDSLAAGTIAAGGSLFFFNDALAAIAIPLIGLAYFIGLESYTGATPVKHLFGYEVRDATTGGKLELTQSAKRNWWRIVNLIPFIGSIVAFIGMIVIGGSINPSNGNIGVHDRWVGAEVVRKRR